jgi:transcriptional regulator GlxA family with amidase domain
VVVGYGGAELLDIASITSTFALTNELATARPVYRVLLATPGQQPIRCVSGLVLHGERALEIVRGPLDTLVVSGGLGAEVFASDRDLVRHIRRLAHQSRRIASVCTGAAVLAAAGLLDGRRATTHWGYARRLAARHPAVTVDADPIYVRDGNVITGAGITSALDLSLALVEEDHGPDAARDVARTLVTYLQRPGNQAQMSMFVAPAPPEHDVVGRVIDHVTAHLADDLRTATLAAAVGVSERHLSRLFVRDQGQTPGRFVRRARAEAAAHLLATTALPVRSVARRCGFGSPEQFRQAFVARYGLPPSRFRSTQRTPASEPPRPAAV